MKSLITGYRGFVGSHLTEHLLSLGEPVLGVHRAASAARRLPDRLATVPALAWDVAGGSPSTAARHAIEAFGPDVIFHLAAMSIPRDCGDVEPTHAAVEANVDALRFVFDLARMLPRRPRIIFASTSHVYGSVAAANPVVAETAPLAPRNAYGRTKLAAEELCLNAVKNEGHDIVTARLFSQSGPRQDGRLMLAEWAAQLVNPDRDSIEVASLDVSVDFLDVRDGVRALRLLALHGQTGANYNIGSGVARTTGDIFRQLQQAAADCRPVCELRPGRRSDPIADIGRLQKATGWAPQLPLVQTLVDVLDDWRRRSASDSNR
jgi:GDP-4-dehydro-6-deoxy-D-mannose reductase